MIDTDAPHAARAAADAYGVLALVKAETRQGALYLTTWPHDVQAMGQAWRGVGRLGTIGELRESIDGVGQKLDLKLSPLDASLLGTGLGDPSDYQDRPITIWFQLLHPETMRPEGAPVKRFAGVMDTMSMPREGEDGMSIAIVMTCRTLAYDVRTNPVELRANHAQHTARHPGELGFVYLQDMIGKPQVWLGSGAQMWLKFRAAFVPR